MSSAISPSEHIPWDKFGALLTIIVIALYCIAEFLLPWVRRLRLRHPCDCSFYVRSIEEGKLDYVIQDDVGHRVEELVLPSNKIVEIEIVYYPKIHFHETELIFGCGGAESEKPYATECVTRFIDVGKSTWVPGVDDGHSRDRHKFYHITRSKSRNVGSCFIVGFKLQTQRAGLYPAHVAWMTDEIEGNTLLRIRVEDAPSTYMNCTTKRTWAERRARDGRDHWKCRLKPLVSKP